MMKVVEPFKSAQCYFFWKGGCADDITRDGDRTFYKRVKKGIFFKKQVLLVWKQEFKAWRPSSHKTPPVRLAYEGIILEIADKDRLQLQRDTRSEKNLSAEDREWNREQTLFVARKTVLSNARAAHDKNLKESLNNNNVDKILDGFIRRNKGDGK